MYVLITIENDYWSRSSGDTSKIVFWRAIVASSAGDEDTISHRDFSSFPPERADYLEDKFRRGFAPRLEKLINQEINDRLGFRTPHIRSRIDKIRIRLVDVRYGSLSAVIDAAGLDTDEIKTFALEALEVFAPSAFQDSIGLSADITASVETTERPGISSSAGVLSKSAENVKKAWYIANTTLLVPVGLALAICYFVFIALTHQIETIRSESEAAQKERTEIIKALTLQNASISQQLIDASKASDARSKIIDEAVIKSLEKK